MYKKNWGNDEESKELAYDLRQSFAKLLNGILEKSYQYMADRDYKNWFEELDALFIHISMKLKKEEKEEYQAMLEDLNSLIKKNPQAYIKQNIESNKIYTHLKKINIWLLSKMEQYDIFGSKMEPEDF